jgi:two-component system cell cycle response regulator DivK
VTKILLVDDEEPNRDWLSRRLARRGYQVVMAVDAAESYAKAVAESPDVILMDVRLGEGPDGWEATRHLKSTPETGSIPVIALTAHAMEEDRLHSLRAGCDDFEVKPVDFQRLLSKIESVVGKRAAP